MSLKFCSFSHGSRSPCLLILVFTEAEGICYLQKGKMWWRRLSSHREQLEFSAALSMEETMNSDLAAFFFFFSTAGNKIRIKLQE